MTYFIAASLPEGPGRDEVIKTMQRFKIPFEGSTNPEVVKEFLDRQATALANLKIQKNVAAKPIKAIPRSTFRVMDDGVPSTSALASTSREAAKMAPRQEPSARFVQSQMAAGGSGVPDDVGDQADFDDEDDPLQHILNVCNKRAEQIEMKRNLDDVMRNEVRREAVRNDGGPPEVKQEEEDFSDGVDGEMKPPPLFSNEVDDRSGAAVDPPVVKEEESEIVDEAMEAYPEEDHFYGFPSTPTSSSRRLLPSSTSHQMHFCPECHVPFTSKIGVTIHLKSCHPHLISAHPHLHRCPICPRHFPSVALFSAHLSQHKRFSCGRCSARFLLADDLRSHQKTHSILPKEGPFGCDICGEEFLTSSEASIHKTRMHPEGPAAKRRALPTTWKRSETPTSSSSSIVTSSALRDEDLPCRWIQKRPIQKRQQPENDVVVNQGCWVCPQHFPTAKQLMVHMFTHWGDFECDECPRAFALERILMLHKEFEHKRGWANVHRGLVL